jgi:uncharacterized protein YdeI (YjbR/CyaY-like superfamily)
MADPKKELPVRAFRSLAEWEHWLATNHGKAEGVWLRFFKKGSGVPTVSYAEAVEGALIYGWIDSQVKKYDERSYLQKFTPRRAKSVWSKVNREKALALVRSGRMTAAGQAAVDAAKSDGRWDAAYDAPKTSAAPADFLKALRADKKAAAFYKTLNRANTFALEWRIHAAKRPETRAKRIADLVAMLAAGKKLH